VTGIPSDSIGEIEPCVRACLDEEESLLEARSGRQEGL
jgi:hypothetical protein